MTGEGIDSNGTQSAPPTDGLVVEFLRGRHVACPMCGYDLRDQVSPRCPECGSEIVIQIRPRRPRMAAWVTGLVGLSAGLGMNALLLVVVVWLEGFDDLDELWSLPVGTLACGLPLPLWLIFSGWIRRRSTITRLLLAAACWGLTIGSTIQLAMIIN